MTRARAPLLLALLLWGTVIGSAGASGGYTDEQVSAALTQASERHGVARSLLRNVSRCESEWNPYAVGDFGHSHGLFQLSDRESGLLEHFHRVTGGASAYDPFASADYFAAVVAGEYRGISPSRWTCWRILYG